MKQGMKTGFFRNRERTGILAGILLLFGLGVFGGNWIIDRSSAMQDRIYAKAVVVLLDQVLQSYPETSTEDFFAVLNGKTDGEGDSYGTGGGEKKDVREGNGKEAGRVETDGERTGLEEADGRRPGATGEELLARYGVFPEAGLSFARQEEIVLRLKAELLFLGLGMTGILTGILFFAFGRRQRRIGELCGYLEELSRGNYRLDLKDNREDELSGMKNELYKMTVYLREQAEEADRKKLALADGMADISHQLKTPLTSVTVLVDNLLESEEMEPEVQNRFLREISRQISGVNWLVASLLKLSRLDAGVVELERRSLSVRELAEEVCSRLELLAELGQIAMKVEIDESIRIQGDRLWLTEAFLNLVKNALEHSFAGGQVELSAQENEVYTLVTVRDYGEGISPEEQKHLFERFYRGKTAGAGSVGIGLALAKEIIERQNGYITVESGRMGGTIFQIKFLKCH
ncbi:MAG: HAMP domain-containing histidine kinase [Roseburia sp.]|nr:HAMP domain-containing histidine kinase [Roseburia sp.]MCM1099589.1 HAMP domain-containing histidine kinase [Ruminococcus flavefaciens]